MLTELCATAMQLLRANWKWQRPLRSIGICGNNLVPLEYPRQISLFRDEQRRIKAEKIEYAMDEIRRRFGHFAIDRAMLRIDDKLGKLNPK